jgi:hypothetical protein
MWLVREQATSNNKQRTKRTREQREGGREGRKSEESESKGCVEKGTGGRRTGGVNNKASDLEQQSLSNKQEKMNQQVGVSTVVNTWTWEMIRVIKGD